MKPQHFAVVAGLLALTALVLIVTGRPAGNDGDSAKSPANVVTVIGEGEVRAKPNLVRITLGILSTDRASAVEAEALSLASAARVRDALIAAGVEAEQIDTSRSTIVAVTDNDYAGAPRIAGYQASVKITGVMKFPGKVQNVIDAGVGAGATSLDEVVYTLDDAEQEKQEAHAKALANARLRATALAKAGTVTLGDLISVEVLPEEGTLNAPSPRTLIFRARVRATFGF